jgi:hypothetical protein
VRLALARGTIRGADRPTGVIVSGKPVPRRAVPVHYLRPNETVWTPPAVICFDTETRQAAAGDDEVHTLRCWAAEFVDRRPPRGKSDASDQSWGVTAADLAWQVHAWTRERRTVWAYAHNLHFDLAVSDLAGQLRELGWQVTDFAVDGGSPFLRLRRGDHHLTICDSFSWLPVKLAAVGAAVSIGKPPLPAAGDSDSAWLSRCRADTRILTEAMCQLMDWWDRAELGKWTITGSASGWNAMRHIPAPRRILIRPDDAEVEHDRSAVYGGRRGSWRVGELPRGRYLELDFERAYTVACRDFPLPIERMAHFDSLPVTHRWLDCTRHGVIARVLLDTDTPRWPAREGNRVWYPVGRFWTTLAGPDIAEARRLGALVQVGAGYVHALGRALRPWAEWVLSVAGDGPADRPDVAQITARHWGRSVVGKWAQRGFERVQLGASPHQGWHHSEAWNHSQGVRASIVDFAGQRWQVTASGPADNAYPAILAFVESYVRVALGRAIAMIGDAAMVTCDTDGMIIDARAAVDSVAAELGKIRKDGQSYKRLDALIALAAAQTVPLVLREKHVYRKVTVVGPQHVQLDEQRRYSGVPGSAADHGDGRLWARLWPKLAWQMRHGRPGSFVRPVAYYKITGTYAPGWVTDRGAVRPVELELDPQGSNHLCPWSATRWARAGERLGPDQNRHLVRWIDGANAARNRADHLRRGAGRAAACA